MYPQIYNGRSVILGGNYTRGGTINFEPDANYYSERQSIRPCKSRIDYRVRCTKVLGIPGTRNRSLFLSHLSRKK